MTIRTVLILVLALMFGGAAAVGVTMFNNQELGAANVETVPVVVLATNCPRGIRLTADMLATRDWPKHLVPPGAFTKIEDVVGRATLTPVLRDEPLHQARLAKRGDGSGMAVLIPKGMRAFTILTRDLAVGVGGFILPGNKVDVLLTVTNLENSKRGNNHNSATATLLQNVEILAVDQHQDAPKDNKIDTKTLRSVTLLVTPDQASLLDLAQNKGLLHLSLRHPQDSLTENTRPVTMKDLPFEQDKEPAPPIIPAVTPVAKPKPSAPPPPLTVRIIRGNSEAESSIRAPGNGPITNPDAVDPKKQPEEIP